MKYVCVKKQVVRYQQTYLMLLKRYIQEIYIILIRVNDMVVSIRKIFVCFVIIILFFQNPLEMHMSLFKYVDEILAAGGIVYSLCSIGRKRVCAHELMSLLFFIAFVFCGLLGNVLYAGNSVGSIAADIFVCSKFFAVVYWGNHYIANYLNEEISALGVMISKCLTIFILGLTIADFIFKIWDSQVRYGVKVSTQT